jgi:hypothetical protein
MTGELIFWMVCAIALVINAAVIYCDYSEQIDEVNDNDR